MSEPSSAAAETSCGPAGPDDLAALVAIDQGSHRPWTREAFEAELRLEPMGLWVSRSRGEVVAFAATRTLKDEMDILNLAVLEGRKREGFGRNLLRSVLGRAAREGVKRVFLEVRESNRAARELYLGFGFEETQRRRGFYAEPVEDAILMSLQIEP